MNFGIKRSPKRYSKINKNDQTFNYLKIIKPNLNISHELNVFFDATISNILSRPASKNLKS